MTHLNFLLAGALLMSACSDSSAEGGEDGPSPEAARCQTVCLQQLCDPLIELDPSADPDEVCQQFCQDQLGAAREQGCDEEYDELISCLEPLSCDEYIQWRDQEPGAACLVEEEELNQVCTQVEVPRP